MRTCGCQAHLRVVFLPVGFQFVWISHRGAVVRCVIPGDLQTSCVPVSHGCVTRRAAPSGGTIQAPTGLCLLRGSSAALNAGVSQSPAQSSASALGDDMGLSQKYTPAGLSGLSFMAGSSRNTEGLSRF